MRASKRGNMGRVWLLPLVLLAQPAQAEVIASTPGGFVVRLVTEVSAAPADAWKTMTSPAQWWSSQHTFSGDAANLTFEPVVGGCFCETLPRPEGAAASQKAGGVQHMRVIYIEPPRAMRLVGALGPLQSEALSATMTMTVKPTEKGSRILFEYVVGGYMRYKVEEIAPAVDNMLAGQLTSLAAKLGPLEVAAPPKPKAKPEAQMGPPASDEELPPVSSGAKAAGPLSGADDYRLPPARSAQGGGAERPKPAVEAKPEPSPAGKPAAKAAVAAPIAQRPPAKPAVTSVAKPPAKSPAKPASKPAPKVPNPDEEARLEATAAFDAALGASPAQ